MFRFAIKIIAENIDLINCWNCFPIEKNKPIKFSPICCIFENTWCIKKTFVFWRLFYALKEFNFFKVWNHPKYIASQSILPHGLLTKTITNNTHWKLYLRKPQNSFTVTPIFIFSRSVKMRFAFPRMKKTRMQSKVDICVCDVMECTGPSDLGRPPPYLR